MKRHLCIFFLTAALAALCVAPAHALEYTIDGPEDYLFGVPPAMTPSMNGRTPMWTAPRTPP
mgnify:CR=1 FL=1